MTLTSKQKKPMQKLSCAMVHDYDCVRAKLPYPNLNIGASLSTDAGLKKDCIEINAAYPRITEECRASHKRKGINSCIRSKLPKAPSYFTFDASSHSNCRYQPPTCKANTGVDAIPPGRQQICTNAPPLPSWCVDNDKMINACPAVGDPFYQADCLIKYRASKK